MKNFPPLWSALDGHPTLHNHPIKLQLQDSNHSFNHADKVSCMNIGEIWSKSVLNFSW